MNFKNEKKINKTINFEPFNPLFPKHILKISKNIYLVLGGRGSCCRARSCDTDPPPELELGLETGV